MPFGFASAIETPYQPETERGKWKVRKTKPRDVLLLGIPGNRFLKLEMERYGIA